MKKQLFFASVLLAAVSAVSQTARIKPKPTGFIDTRIIAESKYGSVEPATSLVPNAIINTTQPSNSGSKATVTSSWNNFTSSMNIWGAAIGYCKPLQWNDELDAVSFIHRKSPTYAIVPTPAANAENGSIVAMISGNCGNTWDSTAIWANDNFWGRYPGGAIYNPVTVPTNTDISNAYIVGAGPTTNGNNNTSWIGNWYASKQLGSANYNNVPSTAPGAQQTAATAGPLLPNVPRHDFSAYSFTGTDDGKMRVLAGVSDDALGADTAVMLVTGTFNQSTNTFDWAGQVFNPPTVMASTGREQWISRPMMAWNEQGTVGYVVIMGCNINGVGSNVGLQPIVYKTLNSGGTWSLENGIDFNSTAFSDVKRSIASVSTNTALEVPFFSWIEGMDCTVDANDKLHVFSTVVGTFSDHPDSLLFTTSFGPEGYSWPHTPGARPYLYDFVYNGASTNPTWTHMVIDSMSSEGPGERTADNGYNDNPWDINPANNNNKVRIDSRLQMSRTPDGKYIVYTWAESDTNITTAQRKWNNLPDIKARVLDVTTGQICQTGPSMGKIDATATAPGDVKGRAMFHFVSPKCRVAGWPASTSGFPAISVPMTVSNSSPYAQLTQNKHWFSWNILNFGNLPDNKIALCGPALGGGVGIAGNNSDNVTNSFVFPNPAKNNATLNINLSDNSKIQIEVLNTIGQVVKSVKADGQSGNNSVNIDLGGLSSGIYLVNVKADNTSSTKKLIIE